MVMSVFSATMVLAAVLEGAEPAKAVCPESAEIPFTLAPRCLEAERVVVGRVDHVARNKAGMLFLNFCADYRGCPFTAVVFREKVPVFAGATRWAGSELAITGKITAFHGSPQIVLEDLSQVVVRAPPMRPAAIVRLRGSEKPDPFAESKRDVEPPRLNKAEAPRDIASSLPRVGPAEASEHVGEDVKVRGKVSTVSMENGEIVAHFRRGIDPSVFSIIVGDDADPALYRAARGWAGRKVEAAGKIEQAGTKTFMRVVSERQVTASDDALAAETR